MLSLSPSKIIKISKRDNPWQWLALNKEFNPDLLAESMTTKISFMCMCAYFWSVNKARAYIRMWHLFLLLSLHVSQPHTRRTKLKASRLGERSREQLVWQTRITRTTQQSAAQSRASPAGRSYVIYVGRNWSVFIFYLNVYLSWDWCRDTGHSKNKLMQHIIAFLARANLQSLSPVGFYKLLLQKNYPRLY